jgi:hypothetical protein
MRRFSILTLLTISAWLLFSLSLSAFADTSDFAAFGYRPTPKEQAIEDSSGTNFTGTSGLEEGKTGAVPESDSRFWIGAGLGIIAIQIRRKMMRS